MPLRPSKKITSLPENAINSIERARKFQSSEKKARKRMTAIPEWKKSGNLIAIENLAKHKLAAVRTARKILASKKQTPKRGQVNIEQLVASMRQIPIGQLADKYRSALRTKYDLTKRRSSGEEINLGLSGILLILHFN